MKLIIFSTLSVLLLLNINPAFCQQIKFKHLLGGNNSGSILAMAQDHQGYIWFTNKIKGLQRYDGIEFKTYAHDPKDPKSLASNRAECIWIDSLNIIWVATYGAGLDRFDPSIGGFQHFRHDPKDASSLSSDTVIAVLEDHVGNLWVGTYGGLDLLDKKTLKFKHYANKTNDTTSLSLNHIGVIYEDKAGTLWVGCGEPFNDANETPEDGGLNRFDRVTGKFTRYLHDPANPASIANNKVRSILEDSKGNFWVGTAGDGLQTMDRAKGIFTHYYYDSTKPEKLSRPVLRKASPDDHVSFITEDATGAIWIGSFWEGINRYDPVTKKISHHGLVYQDGQPTSYKDTITGFKDFQTWKAMFSKDGLLWICTLTGNIYSVNPLKTTIPFYSINSGNTFNYEEKGNILWIGTYKGLVRKSLDNQAQKIWVHDPLNVNSLSNDTIGAIRVDDEGKFWMATNDGLCKFDPLSNRFTTFRHSDNNPISLSSNQIQNLCLDNNKNIWVATASTGLDKLDRTTGEFTNFRHNYKDSASLSSDYLICVVPGPNKEIWAGTDYGYGLNILNQQNGKFRHYLIHSTVRSILFDAASVAWIGTSEGLYYFDKAGGQFLLFIDPNSRTPITDNILYVLEDDKKNLWVSTDNAIIKINSRRNKIKKYGESYGIHKSDFGFADNFKGKNGQLFFGDQTGYYSFFSDQLNDNEAPPIVNFTSFKLGDQVISAGQTSVLNVPIWKANEIKLHYNQNVFSFDFIAISYTDPGDKKYLFMLENYDNNWRNTGNDHQAYFFNVPPGTYNFRVRGIASNGVWSEKSIRIIISPPWWKTWWAYTIFAVLFIGIIAGFISYRSRALRRENRLLEEKVTRRTEQLNQSLEDLKSTQSQLIQSEKMASLGELTAGIAHEIQNPLNFVNNFSEVNKELIAEMKEEIKKGNLEELNFIANDIEANEEKINHHGKRADAIVKGMLQHSRTSKGQKELTDINKLADEYLRLSYHGLRAKDKTFNAVLKTDFDVSIGKINIIPQDIGRVLLNLYNNAFYAVAEKKRQVGETYEPTVSVSTKKIGDKVEIRVADNGNGIPQKLVDKIFQPFFTTKPTGQGTGLGLSLSYDIIKAHGGEIKVETKEGEGSEFIIQLSV